SPCDHAKSGSIVDIEQQTCGEAVDIVGTPFFLRYSSDRVPGHKASYALTTQLTSPTTLLTSIQSIEFTVSVAGRTFKQQFAPALNLSASFSWDGKDAYGRTVQGEVPAGVSIVYVNDASYAMAARFQTPGTGTFFSLVP